MLELLERDRRGLHAELGETQQDLVRVSVDVIEDRRGLAGKQDNAGQDRRVDATGILAQERRVETRFPGRARQQRRRHPSMIQGKSRDQGRVSHRPPLAGGKIQDAGGNRVVALDLGRWIVR